MSIILTHTAFPVGLISGYRIERLCMIKIKIPKKTNRHENYDDTAAVCVLRVWCE